MRTLSLALSAFVSLASCAILSPAWSAEISRKPNLLLIVADDYGYGDCGVHGCKDIPTPNIDSIAKGGVRCTNGYASAPQCSPMRAGLLTGRYPQRFGHEFNAAVPNSNLALSEATIADRLKEAGYATGLVGKWHLGGDAEHHPLKRGFDEFFGFVGGANPYLPRAKQATVARILRGTEDAGEKEYLTDAFGREAAAFIERRREEPFFLYLAFNAPHGPLEATPKYLDRFTAIEDDKRRTYAAMVSAMDDAIGRVLQTLRSAGLEKNTLVVFLSDNGGPTEVNGSSNLPLRGVKGETREGGIRSPFFVQWKGKLPAGQTYDPMVISLDIHPTLLEAAGVAAPASAKLDGVSLLPYLTGKMSTVPHDTLYWRFSFPPNRPERYKWAIRQGNWKLLTDIDGNRSQRDQGVSDGNLKLVDLSRDISESHDLSQQHPEKRADLLAAWKKWNAQLPPPPRERAKDSP